MQTRLHPDVLNRRWAWFYREACIGADLRGPYMLGDLERAAIRFQRLERSRTRILDLTTKQRKLMFGELHRLSPALDEIPLSGAVQPSHFLAFADQITKLPGGTQTGQIAPTILLLTDKRPDYFVPPVAGICRDFGVALDALSMEKYWTRIISRILRSPWWNAPPPRDAKQLPIWRCRSYFLSALYIDD